MQNTAQRIGVLVAQLGTPDAPAAQAVRPYLRQFLSDGRVIDYPPLLWRPILYAFILTFRPRRSASLYRRIWTEAGSPLLVHSQAQVSGLQARLGDTYRVILGMRYGNPSIQSAVRQLEREGIDRILVFPMFPQYSSTTTASIYDAAYAAAAGRQGFLFNERKRRVPTLRFAAPYYDHPGYIEAMKQRVEQAVHQWGRPPDYYLFTFHGIPRRYVETGDPYPEQCRVTARLLAESLGLADDQWTVSFQSRLGPEPWLEPYTEQVLSQLGAKRVLVFSPGFTADCLETLDELGREGLEQFDAGGGHREDFCLAPCLNDLPAWLDAMAAIVQQETLGWNHASRASRQVIAPETAANS
jgi:ferrochelatase